MSRSCRKQSTDEEKKKKKERRRDTGKMRLVRGTVLVSGRGIDAVRAIRMWKRRRWRWRGTA